MEEFNGYQIVMTLDENQLWCYHQAISKAHKNWAGGPPEEQEMLRFLKIQAESMVLELQFMRS